MDLYSPWNSPGQHTGMGSLSLLQEIFPTQGLNPGLPHCRRILYQLSHKESPRILEWVAYPFSSGFSWPRNWTGVSCIAGGFFTNWAIREANAHKSEQIQEIVEDRRAWHAAVHGVAKSWKWLNNNDNNIPQELTSCPGLLTLWTFWVPSLLSSASKGS